MHARPKNSSYGSRGGPREAIGAKKKVVESQTDGAMAAPTFLSLHRLHLRYGEVYKQICLSYLRRADLPSLLLSLYYFLCGAVCLVVRLDYGCHN